MTRKPLITIDTIVGPLLCHCGCDIWQPTDDGLIQCTKCGTCYHRPKETPNE